MTDTRYTMRVTHDACGFSGTIAEVELHDCQIHEQGGRCEDYPACGHTDGDGCQTLPQHTSAFWLSNPHLLFDRDDPDWDAYVDSMDEPEPDEPSAEQEEAWDLRDDDARGHALQ